MTNDRTVILDCDGVLLNWRYPFEQWLKQMGIVPLDFKWDPACYTAAEIPNSLHYMKIFNQTHHIERLPPLAGAVKGVKTLVEMGFKLKVCTSFSSDINAINMRRNNLKNIFGDVFSDLTALDIRGSKEKYLSDNYEDNIIFIDDMTTNIEAAKNAGYKSPNIIIYPHLYNVDYGLQNPDIPRWNWGEIIKELTA